VNNLIRHTSVARHAQIHPRHRLNAHQRTWHFLLPCRDLAHSLPARPLRIRASTLSPGSAIILDSIQGAKMTENRAMTTVYPQHN
jgi:hypothetical protein